MKPRTAILFVLLASLAGCASPEVRSQSPESDEAVATDVRLVRDLAYPYGLDAVVIESIGLVTGLDGTGGDPAPSLERSALLEEMKKRGVENPHQVLASPNTALVLVRGYLRAGIQKGDHFDVEVRVPSRSETTSLRGGWLMETRLAEMRAVGGDFMEGHVAALAQGPILIDAGQDEQDDQILQNRGRVPGGGVALRTRSLGLVLKSNKQHVRYSRQVGVAINRRFHAFREGIKEGMANPKTDEFIELGVHPRYRENVARYVQVTRSIPLTEEPFERVARLKLLRQQLLDPVTSDVAAVRLEAVGKEAIDVHSEGLDSPDPSVRFYAAEALAYLDERAAVPTLESAARDEPAFRVFALAALSTMNDYQAAESLRGLLSVPSAETRYGAFRALWHMQPDHPWIRAEEVADRFSYHVLAVDGPAMIHATRSYRPEIVIFGATQRLMTPLLLDAGSSIMINAEGPESVTVSRFQVGADHEKLVVSSRVDDVVRAIIQLGGSYPDVIEALEKANEKHALEGRFVVDAVPEAGRRYARRGDEAEESSAEPAAIEAVEASDAGEVAVTSPRPAMFPAVSSGSKSESAAPTESAPPESPATDASPPRERGRRSFWQWFDRIGRDPYT